ncbi:MAG: SusD/RagB family nutrient-binding outer membrane lipoprotein [Bacteroidales bacterium]
MKKIKYILGGFVVSLFLLTGCDKNFDEINTNPNATDQVPTPYILSYGQRQVVYYVSDSWNDIRQSGVASQIWCQRNYTSEDRYTFRRETADGYYRNTYIRMLSFQDIINLNTDPVTKNTMVVYGDNDMQIATATLLKIWGIQMLAEAFGDIPYTEALRPKEILQPKYDAQSELFPKFVADINDAITKLKASKKGWTEGDLMYDGDLKKWLKFANSLKLRLAVRMSNVNPSWKTIANEAIADGVFTSNADNAGIQFLGAGAPNEAPIYEAFKSRNDFTLTKQFVGLLQGVDDNAKGYKNPFNGLRDPRLDVYVGAANVKKEAFKGIPYGMPDSDTKSFVVVNGDVINLRTNPRPQIASADYFVRMLDYPTVCFMVSEVKGWDKSAFEQGLNASMEMWGATGSDKYVDGVLAKFDAATAESKKEMVLTQKYMHLLTQSAEAWSEYRRTGYPKSLVKPGEVTYISEDGKQVKFLPDNDTGGDVVPRFKYDSNEYTVNKTNVEAASSSIGGDTYATKLWWAKK